MLKPKVTKYEATFAQAEAGAELVFDGSEKEWREDAVPAFIKCGGRYNADGEIVTVPDGGCVKLA